MRQPVKKWLLILAAFSVPVLIGITHSYLFATTQGTSVDWGPVIFWTMSEWYTWAALCPAVLWLAAKYPIGRANFTKALAIHAAGTVVFAVLHAFLQRLVYSPASILTLTGQTLMMKLHVNFATYGVIICASHALEYYGRYREREMRSSQLQATLAKAELQALTMQIQPHFLFNSLNSVSALIDDDPKAAQKMLSRLGDFLRLTLKNTGVQESSLERELQFLRSYLEIEQVRFGDRLNVSVDVEPAALKAMVPSLILQPIVENAFKHGISRVETGSLDIRARRRGDQLEITVKDNGPGLSTDAARNEGVGLSNTRARLQAQYGSGYNLQLENVPGGGLIVTMRIPFRSGS